MDLLRVSSFLSKFPFEKVELKIFAKKHKHTNIIYFSCQFLVFFKIHYIAIKNDFTLSFKNV